MGAVLEEIRVRPRMRFDRALRTVYLAGLGTALPEERVSNEQIAARLGCFDAEDIESRTGIRQRRFASPKQNTSDLAVAAGPAALPQAARGPGGGGLFLL